MSRKRRNGIGKLSWRERRERKERKEKNDAERDYMKMKLKKKKYQRRRRQDNENRMTISLRNDKNRLQMFEMTVEKKWSRKKLRRKIRSRIVSKENLECAGLGNMKISIYGKKMKRQETVGSFWRPLAIVEVSFYPYKDNDDVET